ncbi:MAG: glycosyltransferase [Candidatus Competibacteraceae bacterium]
MVSKKILFVIDYYYGACGGTEGQLLALIRGLAARGYEPQLAVLQPTEFTRNTPAFICPIVNLNIYRIFSLRTVIRMLKLMRRLRRENIKLVHVFFNDAAILVPLFAKLAGCRVVVSRRDMGFWYTRPLLLLLRLANRFVDGVIANSKAVADWVRRCEWFWRTKMAVIYNGYEIHRSAQPADIHLRERLGIGRNDPIVGIVANLSAVKRHDDLLRAFVKVHRAQADAHLVLVGKGPLQPQLRELATELGLDRWVHFIGSVGDVIPVVKHFQVGVLCSESEGFSNALIEYMACGVPPVCTRVGGNSELVVDGENGFLVKVGDVATLATRITTLLKDRSLAQTLGNRAHETVEKLTVERMVSAHIATYMELGRGGAKP